MAAVQIPNLAFSRCEFVVQYMTRQINIIQRIETMEYEHVVVLAQKYVYDT